MPGGIIDLISVGPHDDVITPVQIDPITKKVLPPDVSLFEGQLLTYDRFQKETISAQPTGTPNFGNTIQYEIMKTGDLISNLYLEIEIPTISVATGSVGWIHQLGHYLLKEITFKIGGIEIQKLRCNYVDVWSRLTVDKNQRDGYNEMIGETVVYNIIGPGASVLTTVYDSPQKKEATKAAFKIIIPISLFFTQHWANALPTCALSFNKLYIEIKFRALSECVIFYDGASVLTNTNVSLGQTQLWIEFIFLTDESRNRFIDNKLQYSYVQIQDNGDTGFPFSQNNPRIQLTHKLPIAELIYFVQEDAARAANHWEFYDQYTGNETFLYPRPSITMTHLYISGSSRQDERSWHYSARSNVYDSHTVIPQSRSINTFIWALYPEERYPMGTSNFTRIQNPEIQITCPNISTSNTGRLFVFARSIQFIEVEKGYSQLGFAI
jgi:hypothetical protein